MSVEGKYKVRLDVFEGPLDLLLYLIKKEEVDIYDVALERITGQYLDYVNTFKVMNVDLASEFVVMAANLMYIKSRTLLPKHEQLPEEATEDDPRWELIRQLIEYKKFKQAAECLLDKSIQQQDYYGNSPDPSELESTKTEEDPEASEAAAPPEAQVVDLVNAFQSLLRRLGEEHDHEEADIIDDQFTVAEKIQYLLDLIAVDESMGFAEIFSDGVSKEEVIVTFLALLELMKMNQVRVIQGEVFGEIMIHRPRVQLDQRSKMG